MQPAVVQAGEVASRRVLEIGVEVGDVPEAPDDVGEQAALVWRNIAAMLDEAGMVLSDIVSVTTYVVVGEPLAPVMAARDEFLGDIDDALADLRVVQATARTPLTISASRKMTS